MWITNAHTKYVRQTERKQGALLKGQKKEENGRTGEVRARDLHTPSVEVPPKLWGLFQRSFQRTSARITFDERTLDKS